MMANLSSQAPTKAYVLIEGVVARSTQVLHDLDRELSSLSDLSEDYKVRSNHIDYERSSMILYIADLKAEHTRSVVREAACESLKREMAKIIREIEVTAAIVESECAQWVRIHKSNRKTVTEWSNNLQGIFISLYRDVDAALNGEDSNYLARSEQFDKDLLSARQFLHGCNVIRQCTKSIELIGSAKRDLLDRLGDYRAVQKKYNDIIAEEYAAYVKINQECKI